MSDLTAALAGFRGAVLTVSDATHRGERIDHSGPAAATYLRDRGLDVAREDVVPDEAAAIAAQLRAYADDDRLDLVITTGGTGFAPRDVTPEATRTVLDREAPGLVEMLRRETSRHMPYAVLSRAVAGIRGRTVIVNLPGSPRGVNDYLELLVPVLPHAMRLAGGADAAHRPPGS